MMYFHLYTWSLAGGYVWLGFPGLSFCADYFRCQWYRGSGTLAASMELVNSDCLPVLGTEYLEIHMSSVKPFNNS